MPTSLTLRSVKGSALTHNEVDGNFTALRDTADAAIQSDGSVSMTAKLLLAASAAGFASLSVPHGAAPTTPANGDLWTTTAGPFMRVNGATQQVFHDGYHPNADTLTTTRNIALSGDVSGNANFDGSANISITTTVADDSHNHIIGNVDGLQTALDGKLDESSGGSIDVNAANGTEVFMGSTASWTNKGPAGNNAGGLLSFNTHSGNYYTQLWFDTGGSGLYVRHTNNALPTGAWQEIYNDAYHPNADTLTTARTISLTGDVTGSTSFDGSANVSITATVADDSHNHIIGNVDGLQTALDAKLGVNNPTFTGVLTAPATSTRDTLRVWSTAPYSIGMQNSFTFGPLGTDYAMTFQMSDTATRGWWWGHSGHTQSGGAMALNTDGKLTVAHSIRVGYGEADTTVPGATYALDVSGSVNATGGFTGALTGNASTATTLQTARTINGTSFDGSANITTANWGTSRTLTIGGTGKSVNGSANVSWSLSEIGALEKTNPIITAGSIREDHYSLTGTVIDPANGSVQYKTLSANTTFTESLANGDAVLLMIDDGTAFTITWPTITWLSDDGSAPTLRTTGYTAITVFQMNNVLYGHAANGG